jgi:hypothetical protein
VPSHLSRHAEQTPLLPVSSALADAKKALQQPTADEDTSERRNAIATRKTKGMQLSRSTSALRLPSPNYLGYGWPVYDGQPMVGSPSRRATNFW